MLQMQQTIQNQQQAAQEQATNKEHDRSKSVNSIDDLAAKVDQLLKGNQSQVFIMEEATPEKSAGKLGVFFFVALTSLCDLAFFRGMSFSLVETT
ncbi:hypothetical protein F2Q69_00059006 [Brassica cretica]|uniref:Uncharacterized protein n=1 Tax=Brassica cretica TaxID=69181 RepID=A0A8S9RIU4_BRACR|nr:hypothetical protein F2Q69_00059006 [Brassica cretica]